MIRRPPPPAPAVREPVIDIRRVMSVYYIKVDGREFGPYTAPDIARTDALARIARGD